MKKNPHVPQLMDEELRVYERAAVEGLKGDPLPVDRGDLLSMVREIQEARTPKDPRSVAEVVMQWLQRRNGGELAEALDNQRVKDRRLMIDELEAIITYRGRPPNWLPLDEDK